MFNTYPDMALLALHFLVGLFFTTTGYRKLFVPATHAGVMALFEKLRVPVVARPLVIWGEFLGGLGLLTGTLTQAAAIGLVPIMVGAFMMDTIPSVKDKHPDGITGWISKLLCTPEALLLLALYVLSLSGGGVYSLDYLLSKVL